MKQKLRKMYRKKIEADTLETTVTILKSAQVHTKLRTRTMDAFEKIFYTNL